MIGRNDLCPCGSGKKWKKCHFPKEPPQKPKIRLKESELRKYGIRIKTKEQIEGIRRSCHLAAKFLDAVSEKVKEGVTTLELNNYAEELHRKAGAIAAPLHYGHPPFPKSICTSINEVICHGIPDNIPLKQGDILNIDITCILNGFYGDCSKMITLPPISEEKQRVMDVSYECLMRAIAILKPDITVSDIGDVIENYAHSKRCSVVHQFVAHGVGLDFHEGPQIPHCKNQIRIPLIPGMTFTIEPMINAGKRDAVIDPHDHWTARTIDNKPSAQWEHTLLITETGHEILTPWTKN